MEKQIRLLYADEIECRVGSIGEKGLSLLLFKDARVDQKILDETFTPLGWKRSHLAINGSLFCTVEVWDDEKGQWIGKQDVGTESYTEKEKGQSSDSFKRACVNWGIGRELYSAPFIWIPADRVWIQKKGEKYITNERFKVRAIGYSDKREITELEIVNGKGELVYSMKKTDGQSHLVKKAAASLPDQQHMSVLQKELQRTGVAMAQVLERYELQDAKQMTPEICEAALRDLRKTKTKAA